MTRYVMAPAGFTGVLAVAQGPRLLSGVLAGPGLAEHRQHWPEPVPLTPDDLVARTAQVHLLGRGGASFPFSRKLATTLEGGKRRTLVVNAAEGEPASAKDSALLTTVPHLVLDGAQLVAAALGCPVVHLVVPAERPAVGAALALAIAERPPEFARLEVHETGGGFVAGQSRAVIELLEGRENLPVTSWAPEAVSGLRGRPTLLSNAETFAQVAALAALGVQEYRSAGTLDEPGTTLLTVAGDSPDGSVLEVPFGVELAQVLDYCGYRQDAPVLVGGYHGTWLPTTEATRRRISRDDLAQAGATLGAGVLLPLDAASCPVEVTSRVVDYLAAHSARRCGPCRHGLPALAQTLGELARGTGGAQACNRLKELSAVIDGRGACAHPDGTVRLVRSLLRAFPDEVRTHEQSRCSVEYGLVTR